MNQKPSSMGIAGVEPRQQQFLLACQLRFTKVLFG
jgi:hypothetical protein